MPRPDKRDDVRAGTTRPPSRPATRTRRRVIAPISGATQAWTIAVYSAVFTTAGVLADLLGIAGADAVSWWRLWRWLGAIAVVVAALALWRMWTPSKGWPSRSGVKVIATIVALAAGAALFGYQRPWSSGTADAAGPAAGATTGSPTPSIASGSPPTTAPGNLAVSHGYGYDLDGDPIRKIGTDAENIGDVDLEFDGSDLAFAKDAEFAPWPDSGPPADDGACRATMTTRGLSPDDNRRPVTRGDAYCFITESGRAGFLRITGRKGLSVFVDLTLWR